MKDNFLDTSLVLCLVCGRSDCPVKVPSTRWGEEDFENIENFVKKNIRVNAETKD